MRYIAGMTAAVRYLDSLSLLFARVACRTYWRRQDKKDELHRLATEAAARAGFRYANEHPRGLQAAIYGNGSAEKAAEYRKGIRPLKRPLTVKR
jgi:hypothetical protein